MENEEQPKKPEKIELIDIEIRLPVLRAALLVEATLSAFLAQLLGIGDFRTSKSLSKSGSLSFKQKVMLLMDIDALQKDKLIDTKYQKFMEIRNTFMHDIEAKTYEICVSKTDGLDGWLLKTFPQDKNLSKEKQLEEAVLALADDVIKLSISIYEKVVKKDEENVLAKAHSMLYHQITTALEVLEEEMNKYSQNLIDNNETIDPKMYDKLGTNVKTMLIGITKNVAKDDSIDWVTGEPKVKPDDNKPKEE